MVEHDFLSKYLQSVGEIDNVPVIKEVKLCQPQIGAMKKVGIRKESDLGIALARQTGSRERITGRGQGKI
jgi:hypothetical protein